MKKNIKISTFILTVCLLTSCTRQDGELSLNIIRTLASVGTLIIAIIAFDKFGLKRSRKIKEVELAREFYEKLKDVVVYAKTKQSLELMPGVVLDPNEVTLMVRPYYNIDSFETEELKAKKVIFTSGYHKYFTEEIGQIVQNIFFPQDLFTRFKFIEHDISQAFLKKHERDLDNYVYLKTSSTEFDKTFLTFPLGIRALKFQHVLNNYKKIISET